MDQQINTALFTPSEYVSSLTDWWAQAGVDYNVLDNPNSWFELEATNASNISSNSGRTAKLQNIIGNNSPGNISVHKDKWPQSIAALQEATATGLKLPGNSYSVKSAVATGPQYAALMIIYDLPDVDEIQAGKVAGGKSGYLLANMLKVAGFNLQECFVTSLAASRPAVGEMPPADIAALTQFMRHQIGLVQPKQILILGSAACQALLNADLMSTRKSLANINHNDEIIKTSVTFHPRTLLLQPNMKSQAWNDLQKLAVKGSL